MRNKNKTEIGEIKTTEQIKEKNKSIINTWKNAFEGIIYATTTQKNIKMQLVIAVVVMIISLFFNLNKAEFLCLMFTVVLIIISEMINTAIETVVDLYTDLYHPKAKIAKDVGAGAVVIAAFNAVIVAYFLFFDKISDIGLAFIENVVNNPVHLAFVAIVLSIILIITLKAVFDSRKNGEKKSKFVPSGQAALAFAAWAIIWIKNKDIVILTLSTILATLVAFGRVESKSRTTIETIFGAIVGILTIIFVYGVTKIII